MEQLVYHEFLRGDASAGTLKQAVFLLTDWHTESHMPEAPQVRKILAHFFIKTPEHLAALGKLQSRRAITDVFGLGIFKTDYSDAGIQRVIVE
ncbi:hypothetical protein [Nitrincola iocasae]|uniref:Uncharacterized protein n=1 Tax=Nitrincola iocasae TaxID=2614693 RepID=A0A5J6LC85_9GAMM|nr:hypothetical protein [Nitrincola iocasae]QEW05901.1 hypothetical protein F5I99_05025 [Nitrincola iocasae]